MGIKKLNLGSESVGGTDFFSTSPRVTIGAAGSGCDLHVDHYGGTFWQLLLKGRKRWTVYSLPDKLRRILMYAGADHEIFHMTPPVGQNNNSSHLPLLDVLEEFK